ncbi:hypothetical protein NADFUDRAFT_52001 [Nadsonia fulvescens var. elongata DSM 6958]|uniref:DH domain-containing protein n=1 Tax=Nadsonia fulvescens var. elongata DSM 6958 TaxID=857566 RepID=A0A1E3PKN8_9ASCO|nr:hypothetical protein NADFUDRAFT_52001 [Nadsonia fulvescens var. elongata DSM 6958]
MEYRLDELDFQKFHGISPLADSAANQSTSTSHNRNHNDPSRPKTTVYLLLQDLKLTEITYLNDLRQCLRILTEENKDDNGYHHQMVPLIDALILGHQQQPQLQGYHTTDVIGWAYETQDIYNAYVNEYIYEPEDTPYLLYLFRRPFVRIRYLQKLFQKLGELATITYDPGHDQENSPNNSNNKHYCCELSLIYKSLFHKSRERLEAQRREIDQSRILFTSVVDFFDRNLVRVAATFDLDKCLKRDYFQFTLIHPSNRNNNPDRNNLARHFTERVMVEAFLLKSDPVRNYASNTSLGLIVEQDPSWDFNSNNIQYDKSRYNSDDDNTNKNNKREDNRDEGILSGLALCTLETLGRSLIFPVFRMGELTLSASSTPTTLVLDSSFDGKNYKITLGCPDPVQMDYWRRQLLKLFANAFTGYGHGADGVLHREARDSVFSSSYSSSHSRISPAPSQSPSPSASALSLSLSSSSSSIPSAVARQNLHSNSYTYNTQQRSLEPSLLPHAVDTGPSSSAPRFNSGLLQVKKKIPSSSSASSSISAATHTSISLELNSTSPDKKSLIQQQLFSDDSFSENSLTKNSIDQSFRKPRASEKSSPNRNKIFESSNPRVQAPPDFPLPAPPTVVKTPPEFPLPIPSTTIKLHTGIARSSSLKNNLDDDGVANAATPREPSTIIVTTTATNNTNSFIGEVEKQVPRMTIRSVNHLTDHRLDLVHTQGVSQPVTLKELQDQEQTMIESGVNSMELYQDTSGNLSLPTSVPFKSTTVSSPRTASYKANVTPALPQLSPMSRLYEWHEFGSDSSSAHMASSSTLESIEITAEPSLVYGKHRNSNNKTNLQNLSKPNFFKSFSSKIRNVSGKLKNRTSMLASPSIENDEKSDLVVPFTPTQHMELNLSNASQPADINMIPEPTIHKSLLVAKPTDTVRIVNPPREVLPKEEMVFVDQKTTMNGETKKTEDTLLSPIEDAFMIENELLTKSMQLSQPSLLSSPPSVSFSLNSSDKGNLEFSGSEDGSLESPEDYPGQNSIEIVTAKLDFSRARDLSFNRNTPTNDPIIIDDSDNECDNIDDYQTDEDKYDYQTNEDKDIFSRPTMRLVSGEMVSTIKMIQPTSETVALELKSKQKPFSEKDTGKTSHIDLVSIGSSIYPWREKALETEVIDTSEDDTPLVQPTVQFNNLAQSSPGTGTQTTPTTAKDLDTPIISSTLATEFSPDSILKSSSSETSLIYEDASSSPTRQLIRAATSNNTAPKLIKDDSMNSLNTVNTTNSYFSAIENHPSHDIFMSESARLISASSLSLSSCPPSLPSTSLAKHSSQSSLTKFMGSRQAIEHSLYISNANARSTTSFNGVSEPRGEIHQQGQSISPVKRSKRPQNPIINVKINDSTRNIFMREKKTIACTVRAVMISRWNGTKWQETTPGETILVVTRSMDTRSKGSIEVFSRGDFVNTNSSISTLGDRLQEFKLDSQNTIRRGTAVDIHLRQGGVMTLFRTGTASDADWLARAIDTVKR